MLTKEQEKLIAQAARINFWNFSRLINQSPEYTYKPFHKVYIKVLDKFARGEIRKLIITIPAQFGKSESSSRMLPAYMLGRNADLNIAIASYNDSMAKGFNRSVQRIISSPSYKVIFPGTRLAKTKYDESIKTQNQFEIVKRRGGLKAVGRGGPLTGNRVDVMVMDDLYKDQAEGNSPVIRDQVYDWYTSVVRKRLHNDSQELIVFTRWHEDDLIGRLEEMEPVIVAEKWKDLESVPRSSWVKINFEAIKESEKTEFDSREFGESLWEERHAASKFEINRRLDEHLFQCMDQGNPSSKEGYLYSPFKLYRDLPDDIIKKGNYTDTADMGNDFLCSVCFNQRKNQDIYVTDVYHTQEPMEVTEKGTAELLDKNDIKEADIESNNGGRGFARKVQSLVDFAKIRWFHQSGNKESRIITNAATVNQMIYFPEDWETRWPIFARQLKNYKREYKANRYHDAADVMTGIVEKNVSKRKKRGIRRTN